MHIIVKLFVGPSLRFFGPNRRYKISMGAPTGSQGARQIHGRRKTLRFFVQNRRLSRKRYTATTNH